MTIGPFSDAVLRSDLCAFVEKTFVTLNPSTPYLSNWHIDAICAHLHAVEKGEITRLIINMPPRMLKSICVSVAWPAWLLGQAPTQRIMVASYAQGLANKHALDCRAVMQSDWYRRVFPHTHLSREQNEKHKFMTTQHGFRFATSVLGTATGEGGDVLIVDDPMTPLQAMAESSRNLVQDWFDHTFASRLNDKKNGAMVVVMQRLHAEDMSGYLLRKGGWEHLCLPAIAEQRTVICCDEKRWVRRAGSVLHVKREGKRLLERAKRELGSAAFNAQYQQAPLHDDAGMVKLEWFARY